MHFKIWSVKRLSFDSVVLMPVSLTEQESNKNCKINTLAYFMRYDVVYRWQPVTLKGSRSPIANRICQAFVIPMFTEFINSYNAERNNAEKPHISHIHMASTNVMPNIHFPCISVIASNQCVLSLLWISSIATAWDINILWRCFHMLALREVFLRCKYHEPQQCYARLSDFANKLDFAELLEAWRAYHQGDVSKTCHVHVCITLVHHYILRHDF